MSSHIYRFTNNVVGLIFRFPSFQVVALGQIFGIIVILRLAKLLNLVKFPSMDSSIPRKIFPLPLLYGINLVSGLGGTQLIKYVFTDSIIIFSLPMFTVLRRFSILVTMILEYYVLGYLFSIYHNNEFSVSATSAVRISVGLMIIGSVVAAMYDLTFDAYGYLYITINNLCTAALGVYTKQKLDAKVSFAVLKSIIVFI